jgi:hypothetical protein
MGSVPSMVSNQGRLVFWTILCVAALVGVLYITPRLYFAFELIRISYLTQPQEMERVTSPDRVLDAVLIRIVPGFSIESYSYKLYIVPAGGRHFAKPILVGYGLEQTRLRWPSPHLLEIPYDNACISSFQNHWSDLNVESGRYNVEIRLLPPTDAKPHACQ